MSGFGIEGEVDRQGHLAGAGTRRSHVEHVVDAVDLGLDRRRHRVADRLRIGAGISGRNLDLYRRDRRILRHRQGFHRHQAGDHDDERDDRCEDRPLDEELGEHGSVPPVPICRFLPNRSWQRRPPAPPSSPSLVGFYQSAGTKREGSIDHHLITCAQTLEDKPVVFVRVAQRYGPRLGFIVFVHHPHEMTLRCLLDRALRDKDRIRPNPALYADTHILVRAQPVLGIFDSNTDKKGSRLGVEHGVGESHLPGVREDRAVGENDLGNVVLVFGLAQQPLRNLLVKLQPVILR